MILLSLALLGCAERRDEGGLTLRFVTWKPDQPEVWEEALERFAAAHPTIHVVREIGPHSSTAFHDLLSQKLKNRSRDVDVYMMDVVWSAEFAAAGWAADLGEWFDAQEQSEFLRAAVSAGSWEGRPYGVPAFVDVGLLYYRRDLLERYRLPVPSTWRELEEEAVQITAAEARPGLVGYSGQFKQYEGLVCNVLEFVAGNGGALVDSRGRRGNLMEPRTLEAIRWLRDHLVRRLAPQSQLTYQEQESLALFLQGNAVFHRNWPYAWQVANDPRESRIFGQVGVAPLPHFDGGSSAAALGGWLYAVSAFSPHPEEARAFIRFMTSREMQRFFAIAASIPPTRHAPYADGEVLARNPLFGTLAPVLRGAVPRPVTPMYPAVSAILQRFFSSALVDADSDLETLARVAQADLDRRLATVELVRR